MTRPVYTPAQRVAGHIVRTDPLLWRSIMQGTMDAFGIPTHLPYNQRLRLYRKLKNR